MVVRKRSGSAPDLERAGCEPVPGDAEGSSDTEDTGTPGEDLTTKDHSATPEEPLSPTCSHLLRGDDAEDWEDETSLWIANYERKKFQAIQLFPIAHWLPLYVRHMMGKTSTKDITSMGALPYSFRGDLIAGVTVGFMLVPQCLAFALLAGLPVQIGLYASFAPLVVYTLLGTIRQVQPGPTALMSLLTAQALDAMKLEDPSSRILGASLLALAVGVISILLGALRFGFVVDFMSHSVMAAFCSAAGVTIATSQLKHLLGIAMPRKKYWWQTASFLITHITETDLATCVMGGIILVVLLTLKHWKTAGSAEKRKSHCIWRCFPTEKASRSFKILKMVADLSSLAAVVVGWIWGLLYREAGVNSVRVVGEVEGGGFTFVMPGKGILDDVEANSFLITASLMAIVGFLETMAVGGKFAMQARYDYDPNQELLALGVANVAGAVMSGYPTTGSFSRTAVNAMLGATSLVACALSAIIVFGAVYVLLPAIALLPLASLAPIIIQGAIGVISVHDFTVAWGASRAEFLVMAATFTTSLTLTVKEGLLVGFVMSVLKTMNELANPNLAICGRLSDNSFRDIRNFPHAEVLPNAVVVRMDARLSFANSRKMKEFCLRAVQVRQTQGDDIQFVIVDGKSINHVDLTGCEMLEVLAESLHSQNKKLILANLKGPVSKYLYSAGVPKVIQNHNGHLCIDMDQAMRIANGGDPTNASKAFQEFVKRVETSHNVMRTNGGIVCGIGGAQFRGCGAVVGHGDGKHHSGIDSPTRIISREVSPSGEHERQFTPPSPSPASRNRLGHAAKHLSVVKKPANTPPCADQANACGEIQAPVNHEAVDLSHLNDTSQDLNRSQCNGVVPSPCSNPTPECVGVSHLESRETRI